MDIRNKPLYFLEFDSSIEDEYKSFKFTPFVYLIEEGKEKHSSNKIFPANQRLSIIDKKTLVLTFKQNILSRGTCYRLSFDGKDNLIIN